MTKEGKVILAVIAGTILLIGGLSFFLTKSATPTSGNSYISNTPIESLEVDPNGSINLGDVAYAGGKVSKTFQVKNNSDKTITLRKITTSCMCTTAKFSVGGKESRFFGMEMNGDLNPLINYELPAGETGTLTFQFDPAAHGPQGMGAFARTVSLFFDTGYKDLNFQGTVVSR